MGKEMIQIIIVLNVNPISYFWTNLIIKTIVMKGVTILIIIILTKWINIIAHLYVIYNIIKQ